MRNSTLTLQSVVSSFPVRARAGVNDVFAISNGNEVYGEIETLCDPDFLVRESAILLKDGVTDYALPDASIRKIRAILPVPSGEILPDRTAPIPFKELGSRIRLSLIPRLSSTVDFTGTVDAGGPGSLDSVFDNTPGVLDTITEDSLIGRLCRVTHANGVVENRVIAGNVATSTIIELNGPLDTVAAAGDTYLVTDNFVILEFSRYITRLTGMSSVLDVPVEFEALFRAGLLARYFRSQDELSEDSQRWENAYENLKKQVRRDVSTQPSISLVRRPAPLPSFE